MVQVKGGEENDLGSRWNPLKQRTNCEEDKGNYI